MQRCRHVSQTEAHGLMLDDGLAELLAVLSVLEGGRVGRARHAKGLRGNPYPAAFEVGQCNAQTVAFTTNHAVSRDFAFVENNVAMIGGLLTHRVLDARDIEPRCLGWHHER
jgi:hypothetical protein